MTTKRTVALLLLILLSILACNLEGTPTPVPPPDSAETFRVKEVVDGDTIVLEDGTKVRYIGLNTPERDRPFYEEATEANRKLVENQEVRLEFDTVEIDRYGRALAYVFVKDSTGGSAELTVEASPQGETFVNLELLRQGYANAFTVPPNVKHEELFREAEQEAREAERGLWATQETGVKIAHIQADAPGNDSENPNGEWVEMVNEGSAAVNLEGYSIKDEATHIYTFPAFTLQPGATVRLYSGRGQDDASSLYWGLAGKAVWNNGGDSAFLRDSEGNLVDSYTY
jgi:micrococcal nuclease